MHNTNLAPSVGASNKLTSWCSEKGTCFIDTCLVKVRFAEFEYAILAIFLAVDRCNCELL
jgi:hypothetical protein